METFKTILDYLKRIEDFIKSEYSKLDSKEQRLKESGQFPKAKEVLSQMEKLASIKEKTKQISELIRHGFDNKYDFYEPPYLDDSVTEKRRRQNLGHIGHNQRTPETEFFIPVLQTLIEMGGSGSVDIIISKVGKIMKPVLKEIDNEPHKSGDIRWINTTRWARNTMVNRGLLKHGSPRGIWEISDKGREFYNNEVRR